MGNIKVLPDKMINLIAAGEVVDRPYSVVKELMENAIDAGAGHIAVEIKGDGRQLIRVIDDGAGMSEDDAKLAFERYATSKVDSPDDLDNINTMGFRGEALPAIAGVSEIDLVTRMAEEDYATRIVARGGKIDEVTRASREPGTTISVTNLFFNAPARAKFLKTRATEVRHITRTFATHAMSHHWVSMKLIRDRKTVLSLPAVESVEQRLGGMLGKNFGENSIPIDFGDEYIHIGGFLSRPEEARATRGQTNIFINRRPVESRLLFSAIRDAYGTLLKKGRFPTGVILIEISPREIDVNVHPAKTEVKFRRDREVRQFVYHAVESALTTKRMIPPIITRPPAEKRQAARRPVTRGPVSLKSNEGILISEAVPKYKTRVAAEAAAGVSAIVQLKNSYILAQSADEFYLIDQHAAHERILYEEVKARLDGKDPTSQKLLFPETVEVSPEEEEVIDEHMEDIKRVGFDVRKFGDRTYVVEAVPALLREGAKQAILAEIVDEIIELRSKSEDIKHVIAASVACKAALKAGDKLNEDEVNSIISRLFETRMPFACPHGRPTMIRLSWDEIERRFLRR
ncbi:MAG: DNA mismatch repair endonuclease MutL [bacterium]|jgi:DNA mismatch repair protein MutL